MTTWDMLYTAEQMPDQVQIAAYMDNPLWEQFSRWIETTYQCQPVMQYSKCSLKRGWNIKYRKGSRAICTVYPESGSFTCLVIIGSKQLQAAEAYIETCSAALQQLYRETALFNGGKWLMIVVTDAVMLEQAKGLLQIRMAKK